MERRKEGKEERRGEAWKRNFHSNGFQLDPQSFFYLLQFIGNYGLLPLIMPPFLRLPSNGIAVDFLEQISPIAPMNGAPLGLRLVPSARCSSSLTEDSSR